MRGMRVLLVIAGSLAIVAPSLAEDNPPPGSDGCIGCGATNSQPRPQADWQELSRGGGEASRYKKGPNGGRIVTDRISYARTAKQTRGWLRALAEPDRAALKTINFRRYGVLAVWLTRRFGFT